MPDWSVRAPLDKGQTAAGKDLKVPLEKLNSIKIMMEVFIVDSILFRQRYVRETP